MAKTESAQRHYSMRPIIGANPRILVLGSMPGAPIAEEAAILCASTQSVLADTQRSVRRVCGL